MPRDKGQDHIVSMPYPVTGEEVKAMFQAAPSKPPYPDAETCGHLATFLSGQMPHYAKQIASWSNPYQPTEAERHYGRRWIEAAKTLRQTGDYLGSFPTADKGSLKVTADSLNHAIDQAEWALGLRERRNPHPQLKPWAMTGALTVMLAQAVLQDLTNDKVGASGSSRAARFAEQAIHRIGWRAANGKTITRGALAKYHEKLMPDEG